jgi:molybdopterin/thiamine biosynthesis adenylyltransferase/rhodanese-related sulfurtransferase
MIKAEEEQYRRHLSLEGFGKDKQLLLQNASVLVIGAGGLGCSALQYLVAAGVGKIGIVDDDCVEISNLQRQVIYNHEDRGKPKVDIACSRLSKLNPFITILPYPKRFNRENAESLLRDFDLVLDGTDNFSSRYLINDACVIFGKPLVHGSIHKFEGMVTVFNLNQGPTYRCLFPEQPDPSSIPSCAEAGVLGVLPGIIGCWQALEVIKIITGIGSVLSGKVLLYNALTQTSRSISLNLEPKNHQINELPVALENCSSKSLLNSNDIKEITESELHNMMMHNDHLQILDVREDWERIQARIEPSKHLPLGSFYGKSDQFLTQNLKPKERLVVYCKAGVRSRMACQFLQQQGFTQLFNLSNGIDGWMFEFPEKTVQS